MDPLAQLQEIHLPEQVHNYPIALGWWIVLALVLSAIVMLSIYLIRKKRNNRAKKQAIEKLLAVPVSNSTTITLVKWAAFQYFPRQNIANLYEHSLVDFMKASLPEKHQQTFTELTTDAVSSIYQAQCPPEHEQQLHQAALLWLKQALPPKEKSSPVEKRQPEEQPVGAAE